MPDQTILVVEDDPGISQVLHMMLEEEGYTVVQASDGQAALAILRTIRPRVILSDIKMPRMNGLALCHAIKTDLVHQATPVVLMSANMNKPEPEDCTYAAFLAKPFTFDAVVSVIAHVIATTPAP